MNELAGGVYYIRSEPAVYHDDIRSIKLISVGQSLLSTCPVSDVSIDAAVKQFSGPNYLASIDAHREAAKRGVLVTRTYFFKRRRFFEQSAIKARICQNYLMLEFMFVSRSLMKLILVMRLTS